MGITSTVQTATPWKIASNGAGARRWFVYNVNGGYANTANGQLRRFASPEAAQKIADQMNAEDAQITEAARQQRNRHNRYAGKSFEQAELEDEILIGELGCSVKFWSDNGINETKRLHFPTAPQTRAIAAATIAISNTQTFESHREHLNAELEEVRQIRMNRLGTAGEALLAALENALALLGTNVEEGLK